MKDRLFEAVVISAVILGILIVVACLTYCALDAVGVIPQAESVYIPRSELKEIF